MKVNVTVDCTPEEARAFLGLPDVAPLHEKYIARVLETMDGTPLEQMENMLRSFSPMGDASMRLFKQMMDIGLAGAGMSGNKTDK